MIKEATKALESTKSILDNALLALDFLLEQFEAGKAEYSSDTILGNCFNSGWAKLEEYYMLKWGSY